MRTGSFKSWFIFSCFVALMMFLSVSVFAKTGDIILEGVHGTVKVVKIHTGKEVPGFEGTELEVGDEIFTEPNSSATINFGEWGTMTVGEKSHIVVNKFDPYEKPNGETNVYLKLGQLRAKIRRLREDSSFECTTPTAVIAVRGTGYDAQVIMDALGKLITNLDVFDGLVNFMSTITGNSFNVGAGGNAYSDSNGNMGQGTSSGGTGGSGAGAGDDDAFADSDAINQGAGGPTGGMGGTPPPDTRDIQESTGQISKKDSCSSSSGGFVSP